MKMPDGQVLLFKADGLTINVEAKELVLCENCKHYWKNTDDEEVVVCLASQRDDAFCSEGERREE